MKTITILVLLTFVVSNAYGQIGITRSEIMNTIEEKIEEGTDDGVDYIYFDKEFTSEKSGNYTRRKIIFFLDLEDGTQVCHFYKILEPSSEANPWVRYFKNNMVQIDDMHWKDYETNVMYKLEVDEGLCIIIAWYDMDSD